MIRSGGDYSPGANTVVVTITPPPCLWIPIGDAHTGSQYVLNSYGNTDPGPGALFDGHHAFLEAQPLDNANPTPAGARHHLPVNPTDNPAHMQNCLNHPLYFWAVPRQPLPGVPLPPQPLSQR